MLWFIWFRFPEAFIPPLEQFGKGVLNFYLVETSVNSHVLCLDCERWRLCHSWYKWTGSLTDMVQYITKVYLLYQCQGLEEKGDINKIGEVITLGS